MRPTWLDGLSSKMMGLTYLERRGLGLIVTLLKYAMVLDLEEAFRAFILVSHYSFLKRIKANLSAPTFPGACGPRPAQYPTHVYTPTTFQLYPSSSSAGPSRSSSTSSSNEDLPQTPISPSLRLFSNKTMAGIRRISGSLASIDPRQSPTPTPSSNRDSYFSYTSTSSRQSSILVSPNSVNFPAGLGVGLAEKDGLTATKVESSPMQRRPTEELKIKRKPVPSAAVDGDAEGIAEDIKRVSISHAM